MTITTSTIREIYARDPAIISEGAVLLVDPQKKAGHNRVDPTFNFIVSEVFKKKVKKKEKIFVRGNHVPSNKPMVLDQETRIILQNSEISCFGALK